MTIEIKSKKTQKPKGSGTKKIMKVQAKEVVQNVVDNVEALAKEPRPEHGSSQSKASPHTEKVGKMFDEIKRYDLFNHVFSLGIDYCWRRKLAKSLILNSEPQILDMAAGTLDVSLALMKQFPKAQIVAGDISEEMLNYGKKKIKMDWQEQFKTEIIDVKSIPYPEASFDAVCIAFGIRNVDDRAKALQEMYRVLRPGGQLCVLEFAPLTIPVLGTSYHFYLEKILPKIAKLFGENEETYYYLSSSIKQYISAEEFCQEIKEAGYQYIRHEKLSLGIANLYNAIKV